MHYLILSYILLGKGMDVQCLLKMRNILNSTQKSVVGNPYILGGTNCTGIFGY